MQLQFASAGGRGGGGGDDDYPDDDYYEDEVPEDDEPAPRRDRRPTRRPTAARQRTVQTDPDDRYWTDYLRIALPASSYEGAEAALRRIVDFPAMPLFTSPVGTVRQAQLEVTIRWWCCFVFR